MNKARPGRGRNAGAKGEMAAVVPKNSLLQKTILSEKRIATARGMWYTAKVKMEIFRWLHC